MTRISCGYMMNLQMSAAGLSQRGCGNKVGGLFGEMEMNSYKSKNLSLLISKIPSIPCKNVCIEWIFSLMSSHWPEPQCGEHENRAAGQSEFDF